jgi:hypothetical protein
MRDLPEIIPNFDLVLALEPDKFGVKQIFLLKSRIKQAIPPKALSNCASYRGLIGLDHGR